MGYEPECNIVNLNVPPHPLQFRSIADVGGVEAGQMVDLIGVVLSVEDARVRGGGLWCLGPGVPCDSTGNLWLQARWWALSCRAGEDEQGEGREGAGGIW